MEEVRVGGVALGEINEDVVAGRQNVCGALSLRPKHGGEVFAASEDAQAFGCGGQKRVRASRRHGHRVHEVGRAEARQTSVGEFVAAPAYGKPRQGLGVVDVVRAGAVAEPVGAHEAVAVVRIEGELLLAARRENLLQDRAAAFRVAEDAVQVEADDAEGHVVAGRVEEKSGLLPRLVFTVRKRIEVEP